MNLYSSVVICNLTEGSTLADFLHTGTLNCREKSDEFRESSKRIASECDVTSERYHSYYYSIYEYLCCMMDQWCEFHPDPLLASSIITTQNRSFSFKKNNGQSFFSFFSSFSSHAFAWLCGLWFILFSMFVFLLSQPCLTRFS